MSSVYGFHLLSEDQYQRALRETGSNLGDDLNVMWSILRPYGNSIDPESIPETRIDVKWNGDSTPPWLQHISDLGERVDKMRPLLPAGQFDLIRRILSPFIFHSEAKPWDDLDYIKPFRFEGRDGFYMALSVDELQHLASQAALLEMTALAVAFKATFDALGNPIGWDRFARDSDYGCMEWEEMCFGDVESFTDHLWYFHDVFAYAVKRNRRLITYLHV